VIEFVAPDQPNYDGVCVVTNYVVNAAEMVSGPAKATIIDNRLTATDKLVIDQLDTTPRARRYGISLKIAPDADVVTELGPFSFSRPFVVPGSLAAKLTPTTSVFTPADEVVIVPRTQVYRLATTTVTDPQTMIPTTGWDIENLRTQVNASDPWIEMLPRSGDTDDGMGGPPIPNPNPADVQDHGVDTDFLTPFAETFLSGGDGLPDAPTREHTGPTRSLVHVNYGEKPNGSLAEVNVVYEWRGETETEGAWVAY